MSDYKFSKTSLNRLMLCHQSLMKLIMAAIKTAPFDFSVICGYRNKFDQNQAFVKGTSKVMFPNSMHNKRPSLAVDLAPYPIDWKDIERFKILACHIKIVAFTQGIKIAWGGDWDNFKDYPHYQLGE